MRGIVATGLIVDSGFLSLGGFSAFLGCRGAPAFPALSGPHAPRGLGIGAPGHIEDGEAGAGVPGDENPPPILQRGLSLFFFFSSGCACFSIFFFCILIKTCFKFPRRERGTRGEERGTQKLERVVFVRSGASCSLLPSCNPK